MGRFNLFLITGFCVVSGLLYGADSVDSLPMVDPSPVLEQSFELQEAGVWELPLPQGALRPVALAKTALEGAVLPFPRLPPGPALAKSPVQVLPVPVLPAKPALAILTQVASAAKQAKNPVQQAPAVSTVKPAPVESPAAKPSPATKPSPAASAAKPAASAKTTNTTKPSVASAEKEAPVASAKTGKGSPAARTAYVSPDSVSPGAGASGIVTPAKVQSSSPVNSVEPTRQVLSASLGQQFSLVFPGSGWLYVGTGKTGDGVVFMQNVLQPDGTRFTFRLDQQGVKILQFQRQDTKQGFLERREVELTVGTGVSAAKSLDSVQSTAKEQVKVPSQAIPAASDPSLTRAIGSNPEILSSISVTKLPEDLASLLTLARDRERQGVYSEALLIYEKVAVENPGISDYDKVLFNMAKLLEKSSDRSKLRKAYDAYVRIQKEFPYSSVLEDARQRARYLDRNYFRVQ